MGLYMFDKGCDLGQIYKLCISLCQGGVWWWDAGCHNLMHTQEHKSTNIYMHGLLSVWFRVCSRT